MGTTIVNSVRVNFDQGSTRLVQDDDSDTFLELGDRAMTEQEGQFDETCVPKKTWSQFESDGGLALRIALDVDR